MAQVQTSFDPSRFLSKVKGSDYLEVKWRLVWLRDQYPDATIETDLVSHNGNQAIFRAKVTLPSGASSTGWGSEEVTGFMNYVEKAETKAIGRALAALGFGTQFCPDFDYGSENGQVVDAPVAREAYSGAMQTSIPTPIADGRRDVQDQGASEKQLAMIRGLGRELKLGTAMINELAQARYSTDVNELTRKEASALIGELQSRQPQREGQRAS